MWFGVLGPLRVESGEVEIPLARPKERRLLAALLVHIDENLSAERLAEAVWPTEAQPLRPARALQTIVSRLRAALGDGMIISTPAGYRLCAAATDVDAGRFERLLDGAQSALATDPTAAVVALDEALGLWRGDAYQEFAQEPFAQAEAVRLEELRLAAVACRVDARLALGATGELVGELQAEIGRHPFSEGLRQQLMMALYRSGRQAEAVAAFQSYRRLLADELGLEPSPALRELEWRILSHAVDDAPPPRPLAEQRLTLSSARLQDALGISATPLIGRESETSRVLDVFDDARLVTLTGPGGVGKTRLAAHVAQGFPGRFGGEVAACALAPVGDPSAVPSVLATALRVRQRQHRSIEGSLVEALGQRHLLLVLDNCEHVLETASTLVASLLRRCSRLIVLATSRARLGLIAEHVFEVAPLAVPERGAQTTRGTAIELFCSRVRAAGVELATDDQTMEAVAEICRRLDGLPLAVELAAANARLMHPSDIAQRLGSSNLPVGGWFRDAADRHRSLSAVTDWSYQLLSEAERQLFDGLSVFAGSFDLTAAKDIWTAAGQAEGSAEELLARLVDSSMVAVQPGAGPTRYALLETLRAYGRRQLVRRGAESDWRQAHARYFLRLAQRAERELAGPAEGEWTERVGQELDNLREARRWGLDHDLDLAVRLVAALTHFRWKSLQPELELWAEETAQSAPDNPLSPLLLGSAALGAWSRGEFDRVRRLGGSAFEVATAPEHARRVAVEAMAAVALLEGDLAEAERGFGDAITLARDAGDRFHEAVVLCSRAIALGYLERVSEADRATGQAEAIARSLACPSLLAWALYARAERLVELQPAKALPLLDRSETLAKGVGNHFVRAVAGISATTIRARHGDPFAALPRFRELIEHLGRLANRAQLWTMLRSLIQLLAQIGDLEAAAVLHGPSN
jgi:predicted ATPase/DNA-binding SARP family transcriptional activator